MNSLQELNAFGSTSVDFVDQEEYVIDFNIPLENVTGTTLTVAEDSQFNQPEPLVVTSLQSPPNDIKIEVDFSMTEYSPRFFGASLVNTGSNTNIIVSRNRSGVFTISGIKTKSDWDDVFSDVKIQLQGDFNTDFTYTTKVFDNLTFFVEWSNTINIEPEVDFTAPNAIQYDPNLPVSISGFEILDSAENKEYRITIVLDDTTAGSVELGENKSPSVRLTGTKSFINNALANLIYFPSIDYNDNFNLSYKQENITDNVTQADITIPVTSSQTVIERLTFPDVWDPRQFRVEDLPFFVADNTPDATYTLSIVPGPLPNTGIFNKNYSGSIDSLFEPASTFVEGGELTSVVFEDSNIIRYSLFNYQILDSENVAENSTYNVSIVMADPNFGFFTVDSTTQVNVDVSGTKDEVNTILQNATFETTKDFNNPTVFTITFTRFDNDTGSSVIFKNYSRKVFKPLLDENQVFEMGSFRLPDNSSSPFLELTGTKEFINSELNNTTWSTFKEDILDCSFIINFSRKTPFEKDFLVDFNMPIFVKPDEMGQEYKGGFYIGEISLDLNETTTHYLIAADRSQFDDPFDSPVRTDEFSLIWNIPHISDISIAPLSLNDGFTNTNKIINFIEENDVDTESNMAKRFIELEIIRQLRPFNDYYVPARRELDHIYAQAKPTTRDNATNVGINFLSVPSRTENYTLNDPSQTDIDIFKEDGSQSFFGEFENGEPPAPYWSSSQTESSNLANKSVRFDNGDHPEIIRGTSAVGLYRLVRRVEAP